MIGARSRAAGEMFERWISDSCDFYYDQKFASIEKTPEPMRPLKPYGDRKMGRYIACFEKQAQPDFKGALCDGSCIIFDVKHTDHDRIQQNAISETQKETFERYTEMGAHCYVMVSIGMENFYRVPWSIWNNMKELFGHKYMNKEELEQYRVATKCCKILFLEGVELRDEG